MEHSDFPKVVGKTIRVVKEHFEANSGEAVDKSVKEQVSADLEKLAQRRESGNLN